MTCLYSLCITESEARRGPIVAAYTNRHKPSTEGRNLGRKRPSDVMSLVEPTVGLRLILFRPACFPPLCEVPGSGKTARSPQGADCGGTPTVKTQHRRPKRAPRTARQTAPRPTSQAGQNRSKIQMALVAQAGKVSQQHRRGPPARTVKIEGTPNPS